MKKILCFIGELNVDFQTEITQYFSTRFSERGCEITFLVNFDTMVANFMYGEIEKKINTIPCLDDYDGVIICPDTYAIPGMEEELTAFLAANATCPVISLRVHDDRFYNITLGDYEGVYEMVEHFIVKHKMTRICFMTGRMELEDAHKRLKAYKDVMAKYDIPVTEGMIFYGDYWRKKGDQAVEWFFGQNDEMPQAIVCSNDYMAISVCNALTRRGYNVPDDICVSGLDDINEVSYHLPPITSMRASVSKICETTMDMFFNIWEGKKQERNVILPLDMKYRNSCGCVKDIDLTCVHMLHLEKESYLAALSFSPYLGLDFENADSFDELVATVHMKLSHKTFGSPDDFGTMYFCMCDDSERLDYQLEKSLNYTDNMLLKAIVTGSGVEKCNYRYNRHEIVPRKFRKTKSPIYVFSLHCKDYCYGFLAIQHDDISSFKNLIKPLIFALGSSLDRIRMYAENKTIQALREQSYIDELTGIPNRRSMERYIHKLFEELQRSKQMFCIVSVDLDGLKHINDTYGHLEGDNTIKMAAKILDETKPVNGMAARTGGDEFIVLFVSDNEKDAENFVATLDERVIKANEEMDKPYEFSMSSGFEYCRKETDMIFCMHKADNKMYESKKAKKKNRTN